MMGVPRILSLQRFSFSSLATQKVAKREGTGLESLAPPKGRDVSLAKSLP